ncbi:MAG: phage major capsid protein [Mycobacterium sp.]|nr:MAG: phage major capsid protein [Mycobacterium sp.]
MNGGYDVLLERLTRSRASALAEAEVITKRVADAGRAHLNAAEKRQFNSLMDTVSLLEERIADTKAELERCGQDNPTVQRLMAATAMGGTTASTADWARRAATAIAGSGGENRAISTGSLDVPALVLPSVVATPWPKRLVDLFTNRVAATSNAIEYFRETARTNNAAPVADLATKPTSVFTVTPETDRCRVIAHISEPVPVRLLQDVPQLQSWLASEMAQGVLSGLEHEVILGDGTGEHMTGLFHISGATTVAYSTDAPTTIRKALTALQVLGEQPNGIALHPSDAEAIDLTRWGSSGGFLSSGFDHPNTVGYGSSDNLFGDQASIRRVISPSVPQGFAIVANWDTMQLFVRESMSIAVNFWSSDLFNANAYVLRAELRATVGFTRPQAFAIATIHAGS